MEKLHKLLSKQLKRLGLDDNKPPVDKQSWVNFIEKINNVYLENDQERYLLERSMDISSRELLELNATLINAQRIAKLGYWNYDSVTNKISLSKELIKILDLDVTQPIPNHKYFFNMLDETHRPMILNLAKNVLTHEADYELEIRLQHPNKKYHWYYIIAHPKIKPSHKSYQLSGIIMDITARKQSEKAISELHQKLLETARRAGMADVATFVLHNLGNVLNSVNVSLDLLSEIIAHTQCKKLFELSRLIKENLPKIVDYFTHDPRGKLIPSYLIQLSDIIQNENTTISSEFTQLSTHIQHIKDIVATQSIISGASGMVEEVDLAEVFDYALLVSGISLGTHSIEINKFYKNSPLILVDKAKLLQIIINLIINAKDAVISQSKDQKKIITLSIVRISKDYVQMTVEDNGIGIAKEDLIKIFSLGYTLKKQGHGFGLHSSALAATEIDGKLDVRSEGLGHGAAFTLTLPILTKDKNRVST